MLRRTRKTSTAFTLIELLIVIIVLGIMAGIVIPSFASSSARAKEAALAKMVQTIRTQVLIYKVQHGDQLPDLPFSASQNRHFRPLMEVSTYGTPPQNYGPYLLSVPVNPITGGSRVRGAGSLNAAGVPDPVPGADFIYDYAGGNGTGMIWGTTNRATGTPLVQ
jgi:general secretion pathway protein G